MSPRSTTPAHAPGLRSEELSRAARLLAVRSRREASGLFSGNYASAFRGGGLEFEESRPYVPGDDVRTIDWVATARTGEPFVKRYREERNQTIVLALDVSGSMGFGPAGRTKAAAAAHALALLAAAAARAGDRTGLFVFDAGVRAHVPVGRGLAHHWRVIRTAVVAAGRTAGGTALAAAVRAMGTPTRRRATVVALSDFRDPELIERPGAAASALAALARRCDVVACVVSDPLEESVPAAGVLRVADPERPGERLLLDTGRRRVRERYRTACVAHRRRVLGALQRAGAETVCLRSDQSPLHVLGRFFHERAARRSRRAP